MMAYLVVNKKAGTVIDTKPTHKAAVALQKATNAKNPGTAKAVRRD